MVVIPFIYFSCLFLYIYKNRGLDASAYIALLYVVSSLFSVFLYQIDIEYKLYPTLEPTVLYCTLITLFIIPTYKFNSAVISKSTFRDDKFINILTFLFFGSFLLLLVFYIKDLLLCFVLSDMLEAKTLIETDGLSLTSYPWFVEIFLYVARMLSPFSMIMIFIFFYSIAYLKRSWKFNLMIILGSFSGIIIGILNIDRSKILFWILLFGLCAVTFWNKLNKKNKRMIFLVFLTLVSIMSVYFIIVTIGRFGQSDSGASNSLICYAGQSYLNFCKFYDSFNNIDGVTLKYLFPSYHHYILDDFDGSVALQKEMSTRTGIFTGLFYSLLGDFIISDGKAGPFIITLFYIIISKLFLKKHTDCLSFRNYFISFLIFIIPTTGIISYFYGNYDRTIILIIILLIMRVVKGKKIKYLSVNN